MVYDLNGNIRKLKRYGHITLNAQGEVSNYGVMDDLTYSYDVGNSSNRLVQVSDTGSKDYGFKDGATNSAEYGYDVNGNMIKDLNKGIGSIAYNHLNLPEAVNVISDKGDGTGTISYIYDATGVKLKKTAPGNMVTEYAGNYVYKNGTLEFFNTPEGYVEKENNTYKYMYQYKDHLGNIRISYTDDGSGIGNQGMIFHDGFETGTGWGWSGLTAYDTTRKHSGSYSGMIKKLTAGEKYVYSTTFTPIDNDIDTEYTFSGWIYSDGPSAQVFFFMKEAGETERFTLMSNVLTTETGHWVYVEKTVIVPAYIVSLSTRVDNNGGGTVWYDDIEIRKTNEITIGKDLTILSEINYYPFGIEHKGYNNVVNGKENNYKQFQGQEEEKELGLNTIDFGARNYMPDLVRWGNLDPLADKLVSQSPYSFALNNPISFTDPDGRYPKPILNYDAATDTYRFTVGAAHLLSLVSGVDRRHIQNVVIEPRGAGHYVPWYNSNKGGGAITFGHPDYFRIVYTQNWFEDDASKYNGHGYGQDIGEWLDLSSHEVGHIPQIFKEGGMYSYFGEFISQYASSGNHDGADYEKEADVGQAVFREFNNFVDKTYGNGSLTDLFENNSSSKVITGRLDEWWGAFETYREEKAERTDSFLKGLNTNLENFSEGTYYWDGENWARKN